MSVPIVCLGGPPGGGKSTAGRLVAAELGLAYRSAGELFRAEAKRRGLDLAAFGRYALRHPEIDRDLDERMISSAAPGQLLDGRLQGALLRRLGIPRLSIVLTARREVRIARVAARDRVGLEVAAREIAEREASEAERYRTIYGLEIDREPSDLAIDTSDLTPEEVARRLVRFLSSAAPGGR